MVPGGCTVVRRRGWIEQSGLLEVLGAKTRLTHDGRERSLTDDVAASGHDDHMLTIGELDVATAL
jgi:hypothetical protein